MKRNQRFWRTLTWPFVVSAMLAGALLLTLVACSFAAPPPTPTTAPPKPAATAAPVSQTPAAPKPASTAAAPSAEKSAPSALAQIVEGAKKEGKVFVVLSSNLTGKGLERLRQGVREMFGTDLEINYEPVQSYTTITAKAIAEHKAGATSTFDLVQSSEVSVATAIDAGIVQKVDWKPLLAPGSTPEMIEWDGYGLTIYNGHVGLAFNPKMVPSAEAPRTFHDLGDPKWRGKVSINSSTSPYLKRAIVKGDDETIADLRSIIRNQPLVDVYARMTTRFLAGEYPMSLTGSMYFENIRREGYPAEWRSLDFSDLSPHVVMVLKNAAHPNAAKLVALFIASPQGQKIVMEETSSGNVYYPGNYEYEIHQQDLKAGLKVFSVQTWPGAKDFLMSDRGKQLDKVLGEVLKGG